MRLPRIFGEMLGTVDPDNLNLVQILEDEHAEVKQLFSDFENTEQEEDKLAIAKIVIKKLKIHSLLEQEIVYPSIKDENGDSVELQEAYEEHHLVDSLLLALDSNNEVDNQLKARICVLCEMVKHHIKEEENSLLPMLEKQANLEEITQRFLARQEELQSNPAKAIPAKDTRTTGSVAAKANKAKQKTSRRKATGKTAESGTKDKSAPAARGKSQGRKSAATTSRTRSKSNTAGSNKAAAGNESRGATTKTAAKKTTREAKLPKLPKNGHARWQPKAEED